MGAAMVMGAQMTMLAVGALMLLLVAASPVKASLIVTLTAILAADPLSRITGLSSIGWADEACLIALALSLILHWRSQDKGGVPPELYCFGGFLLVGLLSSLRHGVAIPTVAFGAFLFAKPFFILFAASRINWTSRDFSVAIRCVVGFAVLVGMCCIANVAAPGPWTKLVVGYPRIDERFGLPSLVGPFGHPSSLAYMMGLLAICATAYIAVFGRNRAAFVLAVFGGLASLLAFRRRLMVGLGISLLPILQLRVGRVGSTTISVTAMVSVVVVFFSGLLDSVFAPFRDLIDEYFLRGERVARTRLTFDSFSLAADYFPLGSGFGRFGSYLAKEEYSVEYVRLGYQNVYGLSDQPGLGNFLTDTQWPAIIGETGYVGAGLYLAGLAVVLRRFLILRSSSNSASFVPWHQFVGVAGISILLFSVLDSVAQPTFTAPPSYAWLFFIAGVACAIQRKGSSSAGLSGRVLMRSG